MKYRTGFVTNSSSANYSVTIALEDRKKRSFEVEVTTYDGHPYYVDTKAGCDIHPEGSKSLSYHVPCIFQKSDPSSFPPDLGSLRNLSKLLMGSQTDFLIWCNNPNDDPIGKPFWQDEYKEREGQWGI